MEKHRIRSRANHLVLSAVYEMSSFGDICLENYHLSEMKEQKTAKHCVLLKDAIEKTLFFLPQGIISKKRPLETSVILSIKTEALEDDHDLEQVLCQQIFAMAKLVLSLSGSESLTDQVSIEPLSKIQAFAIKSVFRAGFKEQALQLAEQYKDFDTFMEVIQSENAQVAQTLLEQNLSTYGKEFACYLCQWYTEQDQQEKILKIDAMYGDIVEEFLKGKNLSIEWMYYMKLGNYTKMYSALETVIPKETNLKKKKQCKVGLYCKSN
ncbi:hypothetical protein BDF14DRAFT_520199 [Spinellus fusiger]|nr:hypothetical protein BDF14DRAFT_520199 [Spinellus fusiger]